MSDHLERLLEIERWIAWIRLFAVLFAALEVGLMTTDYPPGYEDAAWAITGVFAVGAVLLWISSRAASARWPPSSVSQ